MSGRDLVGDGTLRVVMDVLGTGLLSGPEARASVRIVVLDGVRTIELADLWVAPGAPDVRLFASRHSDGTVDDDSVDLGLIPDGIDAHQAALPDTLEQDDARSAVIYCHAYSVYFGHAELEWRSR